MACPFCFGNPSYDLKKDHTQRNETEGAKTRVSIGRRSGNTTYSANGSYSVVANAISTWFYRTGANQGIIMLIGQTDEIHGVAFIPKVGALASGRLKSVYGLLSQVHTSVILSQTRKNTLNTPLRIIIADVTIEYHYNYCV